MRAQWVNLEVPINCELLERWNVYFSFFGVIKMGKFGSQIVYYKYVFPFWRHSARAQWVNLEVP